MGMKVFVLGIEQSFRGDALVSHLGQKGLETEISYGVDGRTLTHSQLSSMYSSKRAIRIMERELTPMEVGCALGHRIIYEKFLKTDAEWALVLEEDSFPTSDFNLDQISLRKLDKPQIVNLQGIARILRQYEKFPHLIYDASDLSDNNMNFTTYSVKGNMQGAFAYLINRSAAQIAVASYNLIDSVADWPYAWRNKVQFSITEKSQFGVNLDGSLIASGRSQKLAEAYLGSQRFTSVKLVNQMKTFFGLIGFSSAIRFAQGFDFRQDYIERFALPFLIRRIEKLRK